MAKTYCECSACGYLIPVDSTECGNCGSQRLSRSETIPEAEIVRVPGSADPESGAAPVRVVANPASQGAVDELLLEELRSLRRMQERQGRSILRWMKMQLVILGLTGLFVTVIIFLCYLAITGPIG